MKNQLSVISEFNEFEKSLTEFKGQYDNVVYDLSDPKEEKQARSDRLAIGKVISRLDAKHKEIKAPIKEKVDLIDGERKRIKDDLLSVQEKIKSQIAEHEKKIEEKAAADQKLVSDIYEAAVFEVIPNSDQISIVIEKVNEIDIDDDAYCNVKAQAALAIAETLKSLNAMFQEQKEKEYQQAEMKRLQKEKEDRERAEREEMIAKKAADDARYEAEQKARKLAEDKEKAKIKADAEIAKLKQDKIDAENAAEKAKQDAEEKRKRDIAETEARVRREALEREAKEEAEAIAREKDKANKARVNNEALTAIVSLGISDAQAKLLIKAIYKGQVPNIKITY